MIAVVPMLFGEAAVPFVPTHYRCRWHCLRHAAGKTHCVVDLRIFGALLEDPLAALSLDPS
jgi:hypothetical protein